MKLQLLIEASPSVLASILASLPDGASVSTPGMGSPPPMPPNPIAGDDDDASGPVSTSDVDSSGMPWDGRIHSEKKGVKADGTWKRRRNTDDALFNAVEAELRARVQPPAVPPIPGNPPPVPQIIPPPPMALPPAPMQPAAPMPVMSEPPPVMVPPPAAPVVLQPPPAMPPVVAAPSPLAEVAAVVAPAVDPATLDFAGLMQHLAPKFQERDAAGLPVITADYMAQLAARIGQAYNVTLTALTDLSLPQNAHMVQYAQQLIAYDGKW